MAQGVKNLTVAAQVAVQVWVPSPAQELPYAAGAAIKKKKKKDTERNLTFGASDRPNKLKKKKALIRK